MIYRIDIQHFLGEMIDHFSYDDLTNMQYCIISAVVPNGGKVTNVVRMNDLYPPMEATIAYADTNDTDLLYQMYIGELTKKTENRETNPFLSSVYQCFVKPLLDHYNILIVCDELENPYIDCLTKYLKKELSIEVVDLNELFKTGRVGSIYIDRKEIRNKAVDIRRGAVRDQVKSMSSTVDGKRILISKMSKKKKLKELERYGIKVQPDDEDIDQLLLEEWCEEDHQRL